MATIKHSDKFKDSDLVKHKDGKQQTNPIRLIETEGSMGLDKNKVIGNILRIESRKVYCGRGEGVEEDFYIVNTPGSSKEMWVAVAATTIAEDNVPEYRF